MATVTTVIAGPLWKLGDVRWMRRWFVLTSDCQFSYFDNAEVDRPRHPPINVQGASIHQPGPLWQEKEHAFRLIGEMAFYILAAETSEDYDRWVTALASCGVAHYQQMLPPISPSGALVTTNANAISATVGTDLRVSATATATAAASAATATAASAAAASAGAPSAGAPSATPTAELSARVRLVDLYLDGAPGSAVLRGGRALSGKFAAAQVGHDGWVYAIPEDSSCIFRFDPMLVQRGAELEAMSERPCVRAEIVHTFDGSNAVEHQKFGSAAVLAPDGCLYCPPGRLARVLRVDTKANVRAGQRCRFIGESFGLTDSCKWLGACLGSDGCVYCVPFDHDRVLMIDPLTQETALIGPTLKGLGKWEGAANGPDGCIWAVCYAARRLLKISPTTQAVELVGPEVPTWSSTRARYAADFVGVEMGADGLLYGAPAGAVRWLRVHPAEVDNLPRLAYDVGARTTSMASGSWVEANVLEFGSGLNAQATKWGSTVRAEDGKMYALPSGATKVMTLDPPTHKIQTVGQALGGSAELLKYKGAVSAPDGRVWGLPCRATGDSLLLIEPPGTDGRDPSQYWSRRASFAFSAIAKHATRLPRPVDASTRAQWLAPLLLPIPLLLSELVQRLEASQLELAEWLALLRLPGTRSKLLTESSAPLIEWLLRVVSSAQPGPAIAYFEALGEAIRVDEPLDLDPSLAEFETQTSAELQRILDEELVPSMMSQRARKKASKLDAAAPVNFLSGVEVRSGYVHALDGTLVCRVGHGRSLTFTRIHVPSPGEYVVEFHYANGDNSRDAYVSVNEGPEQLISFPRTGNPKAQKSIIIGIHRATLTFSKARENTLRIGHPDENAPDLDAIVVREPRSVDEEPTASDGRFSTPGGVRGLLSEDWIADFVNGELQLVNHRHRLDERARPEGPPVIVKTPTWCVVPGWCGHGAQFQYCKERDCWEEETLHNSMISNRPLLTTQRTGLGGVNALSVVVGGVGSVVGGVVGGVGGVVGGVLDAAPFYRPTVWTRVGAKPTASSASERIREKIAERRNARASKRGGKKDGGSNGDGSGGGGANLGRLRERKQAIERVLFGRLRRGVPVIDFLASFGGVAGGSSAAVGGGREADARSASSHLRAAGLAVVLTNTPSHAATGGGADVCVGAGVGTGVVVPTLTTTLTTALPEEAVDAGAAQEEVSSAPSALKFKPPISTIVAAVLDMPSVAKRAELVMLPAVQQILVQHMALDYVDNTWLVKRLTGAGAGGQRSQQAAIFFMEQVSEAPMTRVQRHALEAKAIALDGLVPATLALSASDTERLVRADLFVAVLDAKLTRPLSMAVLLLDGVGILALLVITTPLWPRVLRYDGPLNPLDSTLVATVGALSGVRLLRELLQAFSMHRLGEHAAQIQGVLTPADLPDAPEPPSKSLSTLAWLSDLKNLLGLLLVGALALTAKMATQPVRIEHEYLAPLAAVTQGLLYLELLKFVKVINQKFATYVLCLVQIALDIRSFLVIMLLVMLAFGNMFYILAYRGRLGQPFETDGGSARPLLRADERVEGVVEGEDDVDVAFVSVSETLISVYRLMIGDFEREWFQTPFLVGLFLAYTFIVMILLLNILIAVVSDSYDYAHSRLCQAYHACKRSPRRPASPQVRLRHRPIPCSLSARSPRPRGGARGHLRTFPISGLLRP